MLDHLGESQHTQNIQINKVTGENKVFYFMEKTKLFGQPNILQYINVQINMLYTLKLHIMSNIF